MTSTKSSLNRMVALCMVTVLAMALEAAETSAPCARRADVAQIDTSADRNPSPLRVDLKRIGTLRPRSADEIKGSSWTLGCECLDRDFTDFDQYKDYIVPLGIKEIRLFAGWAKCEREPGKFDFAWLDHCVGWANAHGINVYLDISYGNPIYPGAGGAGLANGTPNTPDGLAKWDVWIERMGEHYKGRIRDYAMWNEPRAHPRIRFAVPRDGAFRAGCRIVSGWLLQDGTVTADADGGTAGFEFMREIW